MGLAPGWPGTLIPYSISVPMMRRTVMPSSVVGSAAHPLLPAASIRICRGFIRSRAAVFAFRPSDPPPPHTISPMGRSGELERDQGTTRSYLNEGNLTERVTGGDPSSILWLRLLPLVSLVPVPLILLNPGLLRYSYLIFAFPALTALVNGPVPTAVAAFAISFFVASGANALGLLPLPASGWPDVGAALTVGGLSVGMAWIRDRVVLRMLNMT